ncbi:alpha-2-macroglobulin-like [Eleutherodactylus coqui]|uniref:alpha-2-macroglobulin-like n=1 Tax=Eleutherodactylus coqui TaxID=57060 RepID=UPI0034633652
MIQAVWHYLITVPINLAEGVEEKACAAFLDLKGPVDLKLELKKDDQVYPLAEHKIYANDHYECYPFKVPVIQQSYSSWLLHVTAHGDHINVDESKKVIITARNMCVIQTDKYIYKPGDTVKFRVISMDHHYHATDKTHPLVEITDPNKQRIAQWLNVPTHHGFAEFSFHLGNELSLGEYKINLPDFCKKTFKVKEYVLKRFEVNIIAPSSIALIDKSFHLEACGRYTYGKPVEGSMDLSICPEQRRSWTNWARYDGSNSWDEDEHDTCVKITDMKTDSKGCLSKDINLQPFNFLKSEVDLFLKIKSSLTEDLTGHTEMASAEVDLNMHKKIEFFERNKFYHKGHTYRNKMKVTDEKQQPIPNTTVYVYVEEGYGFSSKKSDTIVVTDVNGIAHIELNTSMWESYVTLTATLMPLENEDDEYNRYLENRISTSPLYSPSESLLSIDRQSEDVECDSDETVTVTYDIHRKALDSETDHLHFFYLLKSINGILLYKEHKVDIKDQSNNSAIHGSFPIHIHIDADMFPLTVLLVFSVLPNGETIANGVPYRVPLCAKEKVQLKFSEEQVHPGASVNLEVSASAGSLCSIRSVDKGYLLQNPQDRSLLSDLVSFAPLDTIIFSSLNVFTNTQMRGPVKCVESLFGARSGTTEKKRDKDKDNLARFTRRDFSDSWLFELAPVGSDGHFVLNRTTPHSVTTWVTDAFCLGKTGFASVKDVELTTFQPYFIDLIVPYSVVQGETFTITAMVFSYMKKCLLIVVSLPDTEDLATVKNKEQARCVCERHSHRFTWDVTAVKPKTLQIHVDSGSLEVDGKCTEDPLLIGNDKREDSVEKTIIVKPMGHKEEKTQTFLLYPSESEEEIHINVTCPDRLIPGSEHANIIIHGDLMANVVVNLDNLLLLPDGCGEQNLGKLCRSAYTLGYVDSIQELTPAKKAKIIESLVKAYQKQLTFRSDAGSYGFFSGDAANIWVTALLVKAYNEAQNWIYIDERHIQEAVNWLQTAQLPNGCFKAEGYHFNNAQEADKEVARTAFVLIALLEHPKAYNGSIVEDALNCIRKSADSDTSVYTQALLAYAFTLSGDSELRDQILKKLDERAVRKGGSMHWETNSYHAGKIETASYILLALLSGKTTPTRKCLEESAEIMRWLVSKQNTNGGFPSSQDTTLALQALAKYAKVIKHKQGDSTVTIRSKSGFERTVHVDKINSFLVQRVDLPEIPGEYIVSITGNGAVYLQSRLHYNSLPETFERRYFSLNISSEPSVCTHESQKKFNVHMDIRYSGKRKHSNMAVILIESVSGYVLDKNSIKKLEKNPVVKKTEVSTQIVSIYLDKVTHTPESFVFSFEQETHVENLQPATVAVYDFYFPVKHAKIKYNAPCSGVIAHCDVSTDERADCGHPGISREECEEKDCCFNSSIHGSKWCFLKVFNFFKIRRFSKFPKLKHHTLKVKLHSCSLSTKVKCVGLTGLV